MGDRLDAALPIAGWACIWSPSAPIDLRNEAWQALQLPGSFSDAESDYWSTFHVGLPMPPVPLLFHAALGREGGEVREDWMRVYQFLGLRWEGVTLPPDHLAPGCEALATAVDRDDGVMVAELLDRYFVPWCERARAVLANMAGAIPSLVARFETDLLEI